MVRSQDQQVPEHLQRVRHDVELAPRDLMPLDRDLRDGHVQALGEQEELDVEDPRREVLGREDLHGGAPREELEAALGIADMAHADDAQDRVQAVHEDVAEERSLKKTGLGM